MNILSLFSERCGEAELWFVVGFLLFDSLFQNFAEISSFHRNVMARGGGGLERGGSSLSSQMRLRCV